VSEEVKFVRVVRGERLSPLSHNFSDEKNMATTHDAVFYPDAPGADVSLFLEMIKAKPTGSYLYGGKGAIHALNWKRIADCVATMPGAHIKFNPVDALPEEPADLVMLREAVKSFFNGSANVLFSLGAWEVNVAGGKRTLTCLEGDEEVITTPPKEGGEEEGEDGGAAAAPQEEEEEEEEEPVDQDAVLSFLAPFSQRFQEVRINYIIPAHSFFGDLCYARIIVRGAGLHNEWLERLRQPTCKIEGHARNLDDILPCIMMDTLHISGELPLKSIDEAEDVFIVFAMSYPNLKDVRFSHDVGGFIKAYVDTDPGIPATVTVYEEDRDYPPSQIKQKKMLFIGIVHPPGADDNEDKPRLKKREILEVVNSETLRNLPLKLDHQKVIGKAELFMDEGGDGSLCCRCTIERNLPGAAMAMEGIQTGEYKGLSLDMEWAIGLGIKLDAVTLCKEPYYPSCIIVRLVDTYTQDQLRMDRLEGKVDLLLAKMERLQSRMEKRRSAVATGPSYLAGEMGN
jgi:hypothetical protein